MNEAESTKLVKLLGEEAFRVHRIFMNENDSWIENKLFGLVPQLPMAIRLVREQCLSTRIKGAEPFLPFYISCHATIIFRIPEFGNGVYTGTRLEQFVHVCQYTCFDRF